MLGELAPRRGVDLLHSVALTAPLRTRAVNVVTLADVDVDHAPDPGEMNTVRLWRALVPPVARRADRLIAISQAGKDDIVEYLRVPADRDRRRAARAPGPAREPRRRPRSTCAPRTTSAHGPIVLAVSAKKAHKNLVRLVEAMAIVHRRFPDAVLVLPGNPTAHEDELRAEAARARDRRRGALPGLRERRGPRGALPARRAASCCPRSPRASGCRCSRRSAATCPWPRSNTSSLPEAGGDGARYFDPLRRRRHRRRADRAARGPRAGVAPGGRGRAPRRRLHVGARRGGHARELRARLASAPGGMSDAPSDALDSGRAGHLVIRGTAMRLVAYGLGSALALLSAVFLTRYLGPGDFGRYGTVFALVTIVAALSEAGMTTLGVREFATRPPDARGGIVRDLLGLRLAITFGGSLLAVAFAVASGYDRDMVLGTALAGLGMVITLYAGTLQIPLQANLVLGRVSALELLRQAVTTGLLLLLIAAGAGLVPLLGVTVPAGLILLAVTGLMVRSMTPTTPSWDLAAWRALLRDTAAFSVATAVVTLYAYLAIVLLWIVSSEEQAGYFNASFRVFIVVVSIAGLLVTSAFPVLARAARDDAERLSYAGQRVFDVAASAGGFFAVVTVLGARPIIDVVAGLPEFEPAVDVLRVQGAATFASFILASLGFLLISLRLHRSLLLANLVAFITSLVLVLSLGAADGARGAAWATLAGETVLALGYFAALVRHDPSARPSLRLLGRLALAAVPALALGLVPGVPDVVQAIVGGLVYAGLAAALGAVPPELVAFARRRRAR